MNKMLCPVCGAADISEMKESREMVVDEHTFSYISHASICSDCGFDFVTDAQAKCNKRNLIAARGAATGLPSGPTLKNWRRKWGLTQRAAGALFGVGPVAFSKYECNEIVPSEPTTRLLYLAIHSDDMVQLLADRFGVTLHAPVDSDESAQDDIEAREIQDPVQDPRLVRTALRNRKPSRKYWRADEADLHRRTYEATLETSSL